MTSITVTLCGEQVHVDRPAHVVLEKGKSASRPGWRNWSVYFGGDWAAVSMERGTVGVQPVDTKVTSVVVYKRLGENWLVKRSKANIYFNIRLVLCQSERCPGVLIASEGRDVPAGRRDGANLVPLAVKVMWCGGKRVSLLRDFLFKVVLEETQKVARLRLGWLIARRERSPEAF